MRRVIVFSVLAALAGCAMTPEQRAANQAQGQRDLADLLGGAAVVGAARASQPPPALPPVVMVEPARRF